MKINKFKNKKISLYILAILVLFFAAFLVASNKKSEHYKNNKDNNIFTSVKDALSKDLTLYCEFSDNNSSFKSYIKNGSVRVVNNSKEDGRSGDMIMKQGKMYIWDNTTKTGFVYEIPKEENSEKDFGLSEKDTIKADMYLNLIDKYKDSCKVSAVEDSFFDEPKDVEFKDMTKFLEDLKQQMPQINIPQQ